MVIVRNVQNDKFTVYTIISYLRGIGQNGKTEVFKESFGFFAFK